ncbi:MAG: hypothetical protein IKF09_09745 [Clostridiales bacterium]|nr:hypothetical protein [Clostridiales bacterium]
MNKSRYLSVVLILSMLLPLSACSRGKKGIIEVTDKYMKAVISLDRDDIVDLMYNDAAVDDIFEAYDSGCSNGHDYKLFCETIAGSITYEINERSLVVSSGDKTAECDVTVRIVDYEKIFKEVSEQYGNSDDFIDALKAAVNGRTIGISLSFEYIFRGNKWLINDIRAENLQKIYGFFDDVREYRFYNSLFERVEDNDLVLSGENYKIYNGDFNDLIVEARWWDYDDTMDVPGAYNADTKTLAFSVEVNEDAKDKIYYAYFFSPDYEFDKNDFSEPFYSATVPVVRYGDGKAFYNIDCSVNNQKGYYVVVAASDESLNCPYLLAYAEVK